jgi:predicted DNA-binding transcriptional regulator AlpA
VEVEMRKKKVPHLCGVAEVVGILGIKKQNIGNARKTEGFPEPVQILACGPIWLESDIIEYQEQRVHHKGENMEKGDLNGLVD